MKEAIKKTITHPYITFLFGILTGGFFVIFLMNYIQN